MLEEKPVWVKNTCATLAYWLIALLGPAIMQILNAITPYSIPSGSFAYLFFALTMQGVSFIIAGYAFYHIAGNNALNLLTILSGIAIGGVIILFILSFWYQGGSWLERISQIISIFCIVYTLRMYKNDFAF